MDPEILPDSEDSPAPPLVYLEALKAELVQEYGATPEEADRHIDLQLKIAAAKAKIARQAARIEEAEARSIENLRDQMQGRAAEDVAEEIATLPTGTDVERQVATWAQAAYEQEYAATPAPQQPPRPIVRRAPRPRARQRQSAQQAPSAHTPPVAASSGDDGPTPPPDAPPPPRSGRSRRASRGEGGQR